MKWSAVQQAFARHRHEWLTRGDIPAESFGLATDEWWDVIVAYNDGEDFGGVPGDGKPRFIVGWTAPEIAARRAVLAALATAS